MALTAILMSTTDDPLVVSKTTTTIATVTAKPADNCSIGSPRLILHYTGSLQAVNYMYISDFGRYYFVEPPVVIPGGEILISGSVDVLKTYDAALRACPATVIRSESVGAPTMIPDNKLPINPNKKELLTAVKAFSPSGSNCYLVRVRESAIKYVEPSRKEVIENG